MKENEDLQEHSNVEARHVEMPRQGTENKFDTAADYKFNKFGPKVGEVTNNSGNQMGTVLIGLTTCSFRNPLTVCECCL